MTIDTSISDAPRGCADTVRTLPLLLAILTSTGAIAAAAAQASATDTVRAPRRDRIEQCSWDRPGRDPFMGDVVAAIDRYSDIPTAVRVRLKQRMQARRYDDLVDIRRDSIRGKAAYEPEIRDMHFGVDRVCHRVSRSGWSERLHGRGLLRAGGRLHLDRLRRFHPAPGGPVFA